MDGKKPWLELVVEERGQRLDQWLSHHLPAFSRSQIQRMIKDRTVWLNQVPGRPSHRLKYGDRVVCFEEPIRLEALSFKPTPMALEILFEDESIVVLNKPPGLTVHPGAGTPPGTSLVEGLMDYLQNSKLPLEELGLLEGRPFVVHRLDKDTSGVMVMAKTPQALRALKEQFAAKTNHRLYWALLGGSLPKSPLIYESYLYRHPVKRKQFASSPTPPGDSGSRWAKSAFETLASYPRGVSLVAVTLFTGRTHQIRVHTKALGIPVLGDPVYGRPHPIQSLIHIPKRQMLHGKELGFIHPVSGESLFFSSDPPGDFAFLLKELPGL